MQNIPSVTVAGIMLLMALMCEASPEERPAAGLSFLFLDELRTAANTAISGSCPTFGDWLRARIDVFSRPAMVGLSAGKLLR
jgi:hypothetical protein